MGEQFTALLDVTIVYPQGIPRFTDLITGRLQRVVVRSWNFWILPVEVLGILEADLARHLEAGQQARQWAMISSASPGAGLQFDEGAAASRPTSSGLATTAQASTAGWR
jgi:hypothetical protein